MVVRPLPPKDAAWAQIAYGLGEMYEREGNLERAVALFRRAAESDRPDAALRLADLLGQLAERCEAGPCDQALAEGTRWLSGAPAPTTPDAIGLITDMLDRHQRRAARRGLEPAPTG
jgi:TPR repeat protein